MVIAMLGTKRHKAASRLRLSLAELDVLIGLLGDVDWSAHFDELATKEDQRLYGIAQRALTKLEIRYAQLEAEGHQRAYKTEH